MSHLIEDQVQNGIMQTKTTQEVQKDPITGVERKVSVVQLEMGKDGKPTRVEESPLKDFDIKSL